MVLPWTHDTCRVIFPCGNDDGVIYAVHYRLGAFAAVNKNVIRHHVLCAPLVP